MKNILFLFSLTLICYGSIYSQNCLWAKKDGTTNYEDGRKIASDPNGNILVTGYSYDLMGSGKVIVTKYDPQGNILWSKLLNSGGSGGICSDQNSNIYLAGNYGSSITFDTITLTDTNNRHFYLAKYDGNGNILWAKSVPGVMSGSLIKDIASDNNGNILVTGYFQGTPLIFNGTPVYSKGLEDIFIAKFDPNGNVLWATGIGGTKEEYCNSISSDLGGNVIITGWFKSVSINLGSLVLSNSNTAGNYYDVFLIKLDSNGNILWGKTAGGNVDSDTGYAVATDAAGNVFLTGYFGSPSITFGNITLSGGMADYFIVKYDPSGNVIWARKDGGNSSELTHDISIDPAGRVFVAGRFSSAVMIIGNDTLKNAYPSTSNFDIFLAAYDPAGNPLWAVCAGGQLDEEALSICNDALGNVSITGAFYSSSVNFDNNPLICSGSSDLFVAKFSSIIGGIDDPTFDTPVSIFPNPAIETVYISSRHAVSFVVLLNALGQQMDGLIFNNSDLVVSLPVCPNGIYFLQIQTDIGVVTKKLLIRN